jgi:hypothetical protein
MAKVSGADGEGGNGQVARQRIGELKAGEGLVVDFGETEAIAQFRNRS